MVKSNIKTSLSLVICSALLFGCKTTETVSASSTKIVTANSVNQVITKPSLTLATWNVEHLAYPFANGCRPRTAGEVAQIKDYAHRLNADVVALQEVASKAAVAAVFPEDKWQIFISARPDSQSYECRGSGLSSTQQKVGFAVKKGLNVRTVNTLESFGLDNPGLRHGLEMVLDSPFGELTVLNVHMKSGCFVDNYQRGEKDACKVYAKQADVLVDWVSKQAPSDSPYVILGDFNHRLSAPYNHLTQRLMAAGHVSGIENTTQAMIGCHPYYPAPIDHILTGGLSSDNYVKQAQVHHYDDMAPDAMLADHCAMTLQLHINELPLSTGVTWQTTSAEYRYLTRSVYQNATQTLSTMAKPSEPWVVVMDVDETILDNSAYNVSFEKAGTGYTRAGWNAWVASEQATLVPGAKAFIEAVVAQGGKLALVTNRERPMDMHTWANLRAVGLPITEENTCLMGRVNADKQSIGKPGIHNDKDLRRHQVVTGQASCYQPAVNDRHSDFGKAVILMQVGDNIEDFASVTQEEAQPEMLIKDKSLILLPNAMYGSW